MLRKPSAYRADRSRQGEGDLPLIPMLDVLITLVAFLLMATSLLAVTLIDTPVPIVSTQAELPKNKKPLSLMLWIHSDFIELSSSFNRIPVLRIVRTEKKYNLYKFHAVLLEIKRKYPYERQIVFMPDDNIPYNDIVNIMDASRLILRGDAPLYIQDANGDDKIITDLFPAVVFGNILGGA